METVKHNLRIINLCICLFLAGNTASASNSFIDFMPPDPNNGSIYGSVHSKINNEPIEYATVIIYSLPDSVMITGTTTNIKGKFRIEGLAFGKYFIQTNFIGFKTYTSETIQLSKQYQNHKIERIYLSPAKYLLDGVEVIADKSLIEYKIDKKVVNVSQDILAAGGTAVDVLENTPSVEVDIEGNVSLRGSSDFTVLIDNRPTVLSGSDALQQIPVGSIKQIEIITNPSAKYDAAGTAGIINVITKKTRDSGLSGQIDASIGTGDKYDGNFLLNYRTKNINLVGSLDYRNTFYPGERNTSRETYHNDTTFFLEQNGTRNRIRKSLLGRFGFDWNITNNTLLGIDIRLGQFNSGWEGKTKSKEWNIPGPPLTLYTLHEEESPRISDFFSSVISLTQNIDTLGQKLEFNAFIAARQGNDEETTTEWITDSEWKKIGDQDRYTKTEEKEDAIQIQVKLDYTKPFKNKSLLEAGLYADHLGDAENYRFSQIPFTSEVPDYSNKMDFRRDVYAGYITYAHHVLGFHYKFGLRGEYTFRKTTNEQNKDDEYTVERPDYFPSVHFSRELNNNHQIYASYSRRIDRPGSRQLEPFTYYIDANNRWKGNPALDPEYINSIELGWLKKWGNSYLSLEAYYKNTNNLITRVIEASENNIVIHTYKNLNEDHSVGAESMINYSAIEWLSFNLMGSLYYYKLNGEINNNTVDNSSTNWNTRLSARFKLHKNTRMELRASYRGPSITAQGTREGMFTSDVGARQDLFKRKLSLTLQVRDIFGTMKYDFTSSEDGVFYEHTTFTRESQIFIFSLSYRFNNFKMNKGESTLNGDDPGLDISY